VSAIGTLGYMLGLSDKADFILSVKLKCTLVQAMMFCTGRAAHRGRRGIALLFLDHYTRRVRGQRHAPASIYPGKDPVPVVQEAGWVLGPVWTGTENLASTGFDSRTVQPVANHYTV